MNNTLVVFVAALLCVSVPLSTSFLLPTLRHNTNNPAVVSKQQQQQHTRYFSSSQATQQNNEAVEQEDPLGLTPELRKITNAFCAIGDDKLRYKQLLYMATNGLKPMDESLKTNENKVPGCLSTVHVFATAEYDQEQDQKLITFQGDSDGLLTKGLVALLVRGLSGCTAEEIQKVNPEFIQEAQISQSLTPGRNNGFLNMLATMKKQAITAAEQVVEQEEEEEEDSTMSAEDVSSNDASSNGPMYTAIFNTLQMLKPTVLELEDVSYQHAGHAGNDGKGEESHFNLFIVAEAFEELNLVKRHKLIYTLLGNIMPEIHALQIKSLTLEEYEAQK